MTRTANDSSPIQLRDQAQREADILIRDHGSMWSFTPQSDEAGAYMREGVQTESWQWSGETLMVDHRPARGLLAHLEAFTALDLFIV